MMFMIITILPHLFLLCDVGCTIAPSVTGGLGFACV